jgi:hypothetical protein
MPAQVGLANSGRLASSVVFAMSFGFCIRPLPDRRTPCNGVITNPQDLATSVFLSYRQKVRRIHLLSAPPVLALQGEKSHRRRSRQCHHRAAARESPSTGEQRSPSSSCIVLFTVHPPALTDDSAPRNTCTHIVPEPCRPQARQWRANNR